MKDKEGKGMCAPLAKDGLDLCQYAVADRIL